jgi:GGDEF domain-containing protein
LASASRLALIYYAKSIRCADILRSAFSKAGRFVGHVGGDDFFVGFRDVDGETAVAEIHTALNKFRLDVESLYPQEDRRNGYIKSVSRDGIRKKFPLLAISGAVLHKSGDQILPSMDNLSALIAEAKKAAKQSEERVIRITM